MKVLFYDIEILPRHFCTRFGADRSTLAVFGFAFEGQRASAFSLLDAEERFKANPYDEEYLVRAAHNIMSAADVCIGHYSDRFDMPYLNTKFLKYGLSPIQEVSLIDTWRISKFQLKLSDNKLATIARYFDLDDQKLPIDPSRWFDVLTGDVDALKELVVYCQADVDTLQAIYNRVKVVAPIKVHRGDRYDRTCPDCGGEGVKNGLRYMPSGIHYQRYKCTQCGRRFRDFKRIK